MDREPLWHIIHEREFEETTRVLVRDWCITGGFVVGLVFLLNVGAYALGIA